MSGRQQSVVDLLAAEPAYATAFAEVFKDAGPAVTFDHLVKAIAAFERTLISGNSPFDRYVFNGEHDALSPEAKRGMALFFSPRAGCSTCHSGFNFSGNWRDSQGETGKPSFANNGTSEQAMRVPTLRNITLTAPYMHDGRFSTLEAVVDHYAQVAERARAEGGASADPGTTERARVGQGETADARDAQRGRAEPVTTTDPRLRTFDLTPPERTELIAFLQSLTDAIKPGDR